MSGFSPANIPSNVNTLEELAVWTMFALAELNPNVSVQSAAGTVEPAVSAQIVRLPNQTTEPERVVCVAYIPLNATWRGGGKIWGSGIAELSQTQLPVGFTAN
jgi:hypothetical protein